MYRGGKEERRTRSRRTVGRLCLGIVGMEVEARRGGKTKTYIKREEEGR